MSYPLNSPESKALPVDPVETSTPLQVVVVWRGHRASYDASLLTRAGGRAVMLIVLLPAWDDTRAEVMMQDALLTGMRANVNVQAVEITNDAHAMPAVRKYLSAHPIQGLECWGDWAGDELMYQGLRFVRPTRET